MTENTRKKITILSLMYSCLIAFYHFNISSLYINYPDCVTFGEKLLKSIDMIFNHGGGYGLTFFFTLSAFLLYNNLNENNLSEKLKRRVRTLLVPLVLWNLIYWLLGVLVSAGKGIRFDPVRFLLSEYCGVLWYIEALCILLLLIKPIYVIMKKPILSEMVIVILLLFSMIDYAFIPSNDLTNRIELFRFLRYLCNYFLGVYLALRAKDKVLLDRYPIWLKLGSIVLLLLVYANVSMGALIDTVLFVFHPVLIWIIVPDKAVSVVHSIHNVSFIIYVLHSLIYEIIRIVFSKMGWLYYGINDWSAVGVSYIVFCRLLVGTINIAVCIFCAYILRRFMPKIGNILSGGRI